jgi:hypothetical protein
MNAEEIAKHIEEIEPAISNATGRQEGVKELLEHIARGVWEIAYQLSLTKWDAENSAPETVPKIVPTSNPDHLRLIALNER